MADHPFRTLSSGERRRVSIARALMPDRPAAARRAGAGLDLGARETLIRDLTALAGRQGLRRSCSCRITSRRSHRASDTHWSLPRGGRPRGPPSSRRSAAMFYGGPTGCRSRSSYVMAGSGRDDRTDEILHGGICRGYLGECSREEHLAETVAGDRQQRRRASDTRPSSRSGRIDRCPRPRDHYPDDPHAGLGGCLRRADRRGGRAGVSELIAGVLSPGSSLIAAIGQTIIDLQPPARRTSWSPCSAPTTSSRSRPSSPAPRSRSGHCSAISAGTVLHRRGGSSPSGSSASSRSCVRRIARTAR